MSKRYFVYLLSSQTKTLYIGMTNNLDRRLLEHRSGLVEGFSKKYKTEKLVYFEETTDVYSALNREKELKGWRREKKVRLIESVNPKWVDLSVDPSSA